MPRVRTGKIARLPHAIREELNQRLYENQDGGRILIWVNGKLELRGGAAISSQNLSEWRGGGFAEWMEKVEDVERTKKLADYCLRVGEAGGGNMALPASIAGGQLMEVLEQFDPGDLKELLRDKPETWLDILTALSRLQKSRADETVAAQNEVKLRQNDRKLQLEESKYQRTTCELFIKWSADKRAAEIAANKALKPDVKIAELRQLMFGEVVNG